MPTALKTAVSNYLRSAGAARGTRAEYQTTLHKWKQWGNGVPIERLGRKEIREFLEWVYERAVADGGTNPGRTANKAREQLRAVISWAWDQEIIDAPPRFPNPREQRNVAGRHYLTKPEINALYFATYMMSRPRGWNDPVPVGRYWRAALVLFFNYGLDTGTVWKFSPDHEPILWRHVSWDRQSPDGQLKQQSPWGWIFYRRVKTGKTFYRPMNRVVHAHIKSVKPDDPRPDDPVVLGGGARPNSRFQELCRLAGIHSKMSVETGKDEPWLLKDLRKTCATYYDQHVPESSIEILGHSVPGITYRHYAHRAPLAFNAIMTLPQPTAFRALLNGFDGECPCCRRPFVGET
ncbi:MAG: tyrosine-type recombinase/integrase [Deltaproteobacteria bacterium]